MTELFNHMDWDGMVNFILRVVAVFLCIVIHEVSHGLAAYQLGDPTAKEGHRLSLNPIRHIDPIGLLMMVVVGFGWAKPVPVNPNYFKNPKSGMAITALAGPLSNFVLAFVTALCLNGALGFYAAQGPSPILVYILEFLMVTTSLNIGLGIFNLIPFPPLDGSKILGAILPESTYFKLMQYERFGMLILFAALWLGFLDGPLFAARSWMMNVVLDSTLFMRELMLSILR